MGPADNHDQDPQQPERLDDPIELEVAAALANYMRKCDSGELPDREAFLAEHPELSGQLLDLLSAADWIEEMAGPTAGDSAVQASGGPTTSFGGLEYDPAKSASASVPTDETLPHGRIAKIDDGHNETLPSPHSTQPLDASRARELSQPVLPCQFDDYLLESVLGRGGMGVVYFGRQTRLERPVAVKMIRSGALASEEEVQRFYAEARSAARLDHPNIVTVYQCGEHQGHHYFSMDYVSGTDLARITKDKPLDCKTAARYVRDVALAIQYAHDRGILHRDLKPANVLVDDFDNVRITDFGLAKTIDHESGLTATGAALGTPSYMSPEQAAGRTNEQHHATDVYSLGAILFTIVTGQPPFKASSVVQTLMQVIHRPAPTACSVNPSVDADLDTIIDVCLQKSPDRRYKSCQDLAADLTRYLEGRPILAKPVPIWRRAWYWLLGIPVVGAVLDNRVVEPTNAHRWVQRGLISIALLIAMAWMLALLSTSVWFTNRMPATISIGGGAPGSSYTELASVIGEALSEAVGRPVEILPSAGSTENLEKLYSGDVDLAILQENSVDSASLSVIAPLYYEAVHVLVNSELDLQQVSDLAGHRVIVGSQKSGSSQVAKLVLSRAGISISDVEVDESDWRRLADKPTSDAAIVVTKLGSTLISKILCTGEYRLLPISDYIDFAMHEHTFHACIVDSRYYPDCDLPVGGVATVATTAFLATRDSAPAVLVNAALTTLFQPEIVTAQGILPPEDAANWQGLDWHPTAREFFRPYRGGTATTAAAP